MLAGYFLLTYLNNTGMTGDVKILAGINIFVASLMFGVSFIRTKSLAMLLGLHLMANFMQGGVLGFGVSGTNLSGILKPILTGVPGWLTGGQFEPEASALGFVCVVITFILIQRWNVPKEMVIHM